MTSCVSLVSLFLLFSMVSAFSSVARLNNVGSNSRISLNMAKVDSAVDGLSRRNWLASAGAAVVASSAWMVDPSTVLAADEKVTTKTEEYLDTDCKFTVQVPSGWTKTVQSLPDRRKIVLYIEPDSNQKTLVFFAYTPVRDDFTSLGSFGYVDEVAQATILPKSELAMVEGVSSKMLSAESRKQAYYFDYVQTVPQQPETHFRTIFTLVPGATGGAGNVLVTITAQTPESGYASFKPLFDDIMNSFNNKV